MNRIKAAAAYAALILVAAILAMLGWGCGVDHEQDIRLDMAMRRP